MKRPKTIAFLLFVCIQLCRAQTDTIFVTEKILIPCKVTHVTKETLHYSDSKNLNSTIDLNQIKFYSVNGTRISGTYISPIIPKIASDNNTQQNEIDYMKTCLRRGHQQFTNGLIAGAFGLALAGIGSAVKNEETNGAEFILGLGGAMTIIGTIVMIDSHKWQKRAGVGFKAKSNGVAVNYRFR